MLASQLPVGHAEPTFSILEGIRVLDLTTSIAGPYATMLLSDFGAEVIKVERHSGDDARHWGPPFLDGESLWFLSVNRNKRSICLEYGNEAGRTVLDALLDVADVVVINQTPEVQSKLGMRPEDLRKGRESLVVATITGFGLNGSKSLMPCYDLIAEGYSGIMDLTGPASAEPQKVGAPAADMLAGSDAAMGVLAALYRRRDTGKGGVVDIALTESMIRFTSPRIIPYLGSGEVSRRTGGRDSVIAIYQTFQTADEPLTLSLGTDRIWHRFWVLVEQPDFGQDAGLASNAQRRVRREEIVAEIQTILLSKPRAEWLTLLAEAGVPAGPIYRVDEVTEDPHFHDRKLFFRIERDGHSLPQVGLGIHIDGKAPGYFSAPPRLGEHSSEVLRDCLGYSEQTLEALRDKKVI
ncbi:CoA transferase [Pseudomonas synxantha]|uniref:CoA transferase n=1 Tax=Pseudomonas synxantha TaxID=47883 RepID=A0ABS0URN9_9PSED|nr:CoA transferase [Pseudomonas synxantha]MBI6567083.1 CoA transferase [Pseudomonas synxantha]MBI6583408.1 CoA transferase [Pseudomonas synxantha]MBI6643406.1 CoA transferase [Pseudomonas synxantha]